MQYIKHTSLEYFLPALELPSKEVWLCVMYIHYSGLGLNYTGSFIYLETYGYPYVYPHNYDEVILLLFLTTYGLFTDLETDVGMEPGARGI